MSSQQEDSKFIRILGIVASVMAVAMYVSYLPQIMANLNGQKGDYFQPLIAAINCSLWVLYGIKKKDKPILIANSPGVIFGIIACLTALL